MKNLVTCRKNPGPLYEDLPQIVGVPDEAPPAGHDELLVAGGGEGLQVGQRGVRRVLGKLATLGLARPATRDYSQSQLLFWVTSNGRCVKERSVFVFHILFI